MKEMLHTVSANDGEHYTWGDMCDGWHLVKSKDVSVIQERVPPGKSEVMHFHKVSRQFFFILEGEATIAAGSQKIKLTKHQGVEIPPGVHHQFCNEASTDVSFLVVSVPKSHGDRVDILSAQ